MSVFSSPKFLRNVMLADAASCAGTGALQVLFAAPLAALLQLPAPLLTATGWFLVAYAACAAFVGTRDPIPRGWIPFFAAGNVVWAILCIGLLVNGSVHPSTLGVVWVLAQVAVVLVLADLQWVGMKRYPVQGWA